MNVNKKIALPVVGAVLLLGGVGAVAAGGSESNDDKAQQSVQGTSDHTDTSNADETAQHDQADTQQATQQGSNSESAGSQSSATPSTAQTQGASDNSTPTSTSDAPTDTPDASPTEQPVTRGGDNDLEVIDVVPVPVDDGGNDGGPTISPNPVRGGGGAGIGTSR